MEHLGIKMNVRNVPQLDLGFQPISQFCMAYLKSAKKPVSICIERDNGLCSVYDTYIIGANRLADRFYIDRVVKTLLWIKGGYRVSICGDDDAATYIRDAYASGGARAFDSQFMSRVYEREFEVVSLPISKKPALNEKPRPIGGFMAGCRIGFDAGGSDRKVSAVINGNPVYSEEVVWHPKKMSDPDYHYNEILTAFKTAASKMPRVDAIGVSSAGIYIGNRTMAASLFLKVPPEAFERKVKDIYIRAARELGDVPLQVANDGDVTALAGAIELSSSNILGTAMGTSEAGGYIDDNGNITGWLNELAFVPVDVNKNAMADEWSGDIGCGVKYFSQDGAIKLAKTAGIEMDPLMPPGEKLQVLQDMFSHGDQRVVDIYKSIGCYLGHSLPYYHGFYGFKHVLLLGRVMSGEGGNIIADTARKVLGDEYGSYDISLHIPDEGSRRVGQSVAAASL